MEKGFSIEQQLLWSVGPEDEQRPFRRAGVASVALGDERVRFSPRNQNGRDRREGIGACL